MSSERISMGGAILRCLVLIVLLDHAQVVRGQDLESRKADAPSNLWTREKGVDWPTFLGPTADGHSPETGIVKDWSNGNLKILWSIDVGEGYGIGSVSRGRYVHFDRHQGDARVRCFRAETGKPLWEFRYASEYRDLYGYDSGPRASPVIDGPRTYVFGVEGRLHCLETETGNVIWKLDTGEKFGVIQNFFGVASTPVVFNDSLLLMIGGSPEESKRIPAGALDRVKPNGSAIVAVNKFTGVLQYQVGDDLASYSTIKITEINGEKLAAAWMRGQLIGFDPSTGVIRFQFPWRAKKLESVNASTPVIKENQMLLTECYELGSVLLNLADDQPEIIWSDKGRREKSLAAHWNTPIRIDGNLYGCSGRHAGNAELRCVDWLTGEVRWSEEKFTRSQLTAVDNHLIVLDENGRLVLIRANPDRYEEVTAFDGGEQQLRFQPPCWAAPVISHGLMFVRGRDRLVCFELIPQS